MKPEEIHPRLAPGEQFEMDVTPETRERAALEALWDTANRQRDRLEALVEFSVRHQVPLGAPVPPPEMLLRSADGPYAAWDRWLAREYDAVAARVVAQLGSGSARMIDDNDEVAGWSLVYVDAVGRLHSHTLLTPRPPDGPPHDPSGSTGEAP